jgi:hypothetical protein
LSRPLATSPSRGALVNFCQKEAGLKDEAMGSITINDYRALEIHIAGALLGVAMLFTSACAKPAPDPLEKPIPAIVKAGTTLTADPDPIVTSEGTGLGETTLHWSTTAAHVEMHVDAPGGPLMGTGESQGSMRTGQWVRDGMKFYLQDRDAPDRTSAAATLGTIAIVVQ